MISIFSGLFFSCNELVMEEQIPDDLELKSSITGKQSYVVLLSDANLDIELSGIKGYEMRQQAMRAASHRILLRAGIADSEVEHLYSNAVKGFSVKIPPGQLKKLQDDPSVFMVEPDQIITLVDPVAKPGEGDVNINEATQVMPWGIGRVNGGADGTGKRAWVIDTGIDLDHPDLNVDIDNSRTFLSRTTPDDQNGHGTHVAGIIAAKNNDIGVIGVAAGAAVVSVRVLDRRGSGSYSTIIAGVDYVASAASAGDVANMSLGGSAYEPLDLAIKNAAEEKGIFFTLAAGNSSADANNYSPARVNGTNIYTISAMEKNDKWAYYSNYGNPPIDYCAPGSGIYSCYKDGNYTTLSGTSMAAPHVAGILLLGEILSDKCVIGDPDGNPDTIAVATNNSTPNNAPTAKANGPYTGTEDIAVDFSAAGSSDPDNDQLTYTWNFGDNSDTETTTSESVSHAYAWGGIFDVSLTVSDGKGGKDTVYTTATITEVNDIPVAVLEGPVNGTIGASVTFNGSGSHDFDNEDGTIENDQLLTYSWDMGDGTTFQDGEAIYSHTFNEAGKYLVTLTVSDGAGGTDQDSLTINITETSVTNIDLISATLSKVRGIRYVTLIWEGATGDNVNIYANGTFRETVSNDTGTATINMERSSGTFEFQVCETDGSGCSNTKELEL